MSSERGIRAPSRGEESHLTREEEEFIRRYLARPESFPPEFWSAVIQKVSLDIDKIPGSQIVGGTTNLSATNADAIATEESTTSLTYTDLATAGPTITGLSNGTYLVLFGCLMRESNAAGEQSIMSIQVNSTAASDSVACAMERGIGLQSASSFFVTALEENNNNTLTAKYKVSAASTGYFANRRLTAIKIGN